MIITITMDSFDKETIYKMIYQIEEILIENGIAVKNLIKNEYFVNIFHQISEVVLKKESLKPKEFLINTIIKEIVKYITKNSSNFVEISEEQENQITNIQKEYTSTFFFKESKGVSLQKVRSICIKGLYIKDRTFIINEKNNKITIRERIDQSKELYTENRTILIECGNYTKENLIKELNFKFSISRLLHKYHFYSDFITNKICISTFNYTNKTEENIISILSNLKLEDSELFDIIYKESSIMSILGFTEIQKLNNNSIYISSSPMDLKKNDFIKLSISIDDYKSQFMFKKNKENYIYETNILKKEYSPFQRIEKVSINLNEDVIDYDIDTLVEVIYFQNE